MSQRILITGAAGYIGSHFIEEVYETAPPFLAGVEFIFVDDLSSGHEASIRSLIRLAKEKGFPEPLFFKINLLHERALSEVFENTKPEAVMHFAGKISVAESVANPDFYFENNVIGSKNLLNAMKKQDCKRIVFSSTAAVYGKVLDITKANHPILESTPLLPINPYGETKLLIENAIREAHDEWGLDSVIFRYFNAAGASLSGRLGELHEPETHLIPLLVRAVLLNQPLKIFGTDYDTRDGSCIRDFVHVKDLAMAHLLGLQKLNEGSIQSPLVLNLGTEHGTSVFEVVKSVEILTGKSIQREFGPKRSGDSAVLIADSNQAKSILGWKAKYSSIHSILSSVLSWESANSKSKKKD